MVEIIKGLQDVIALETHISYIDGENGILRYRGIDINDLVNLPYDSVSYLLLKGSLPDVTELATFSKKLKDERVINENLIQAIRTCNFNIEAMDALRTVVSHMSHCDPDLNDNSHDANIRKSTKLISRFPTIVASFSRIKNGYEPLMPDTNLSHGANFLYMLNGEKPEKTVTEIMEKDFILIAEHELNASTFSTRITASTLSDLYSAIISGLGTLKGPLHGGARMAVMNMLDEVDSSDDAEQYVMDLIENHQKIMGFGHRVYKTYDPRSNIYKGLAKKLAEEKSDTTLYEIAERIENTVIRELVEKRNKPIYPNADFYSGVIYKYLGLHPKLATSVFAIGRVSGWIAHCLEQYSDNKLIRPRARSV
ncbi:MAG: citrate/2-methylcitrate synthase [Methanohalobium sp.]|uniref:citrate/2-methylcitrate synthase n=1 Tax=Methanohalobium sp. TaxID=2837493 RepID=UPI00397C2CFD